MSRDVQLVDRKNLSDGYLHVDQVTVRHRLFAGGWSGPVRREIVQRGYAVGVLPYDPVRDEVVLVRQFRVGPWQAKDDPWVVETVAGIIEDGESADDVARRETVEECGCTITQLHRVCDYYSSPGILDERITLFCGITDATGAGGIHGLDHEGEDIEAFVRRREDAWADLEAGLFTDPKLLILVPWLERNWKMLQK